MEVATDSDQQQVEGASKTKSPPETGADSEAGSPSLEDLQQGARIAAEQARQWVVQHPFAALGIAVTAGFFVGRLVRR